MSIRIMVVDDSSFSRVILADSLQQEGYEVVGEAESLESLVETYDQCKPDIVTMDIAMPGADGFECSKVLLAHDPLAKIILISSMKDEETEAEAKRTGVLGYLQKPAEPELLKRVIEGVMSPDTLYKQLEDWGVGVFQEALGQSITRMTKTIATFSESQCADKHISQGITIVIGIIGRYSGSMIMDFSQETAAKMAEVILRRPPKGQEEIVAMCAEFANIVGGIACSMLNKKDQSFSLRVSPPSVFYGVQTEIASPSVQLRGMYADTDFGRVYLGAGFKKGRVLWM
ncbi:MAG: response regulator containing a CheY-like receiver domain and an DNA-binding domain [Firmicutes bacterium]|nr:response regulator containing a CheY-like receiver domain and an DNA-binding domain [Bacillota bacterium]